MAGPALRTPSRHRANRPLRRFLLVPSFLILITNIMTLYISHRLPDDPMYLVKHLSIYSAFACVLSSLGIVGIWQKNTTLVSVFSNYLFIDAVICAVPRVLLFFIFPEMRNSICSLDSMQLWLQSQAKFSDNTTDNEREATMNDLQWQCRNVVGTVQIIVGMLAIAATVMQVLLAVKTRRYAFVLQRTDLLAQEEIGSTEMSEDRGAPLLTRYRDYEEPTKSSKEHYSVTV